MLDKLLRSPLTSSVANPPASSASAAPQHASCCSDAPANSTALGVVGMLRRLKLWTEGDAANGKLTILPSSIAAWLRSTGRYGENTIAIHPLLLLVPMQTLLQLKVLLLRGNLLFEFLVMHVPCVSSGWQPLYSHVPVFIRP